MFRPVDSLRILNRFVRTVQERLKSLEDSERLPKKYTETPKRVIQFLRDHQPPPLRSIFHWAGTLRELLTRSDIDFAAPPVKPETASSPSHDIPAVLRVPTGEEQVNSFFKMLLGRVEPGVAKEGDSYLLEHTFDLEKVRRYRSVTGHPDLPEGSEVLVPSAYTFVVAFPVIVEAIKPLLREANFKTIIHGAEEVSMDSISASSRVLIRVSIKKVLARPGQPTTIILDREFLEQGTEKVLMTGRTTLVIGVDPKAMTPTLAKPEECTDESVLLQMLITDRLIDDYMEVSDDRNVVHVSNEAAKFLGLPLRVAHGMLTWNFAEVALLRGEGPEKGLGRRTRKARFKGFLFPGDSSAFSLHNGKIFGHKAGPDRERISVIEFEMK